MPIFRGNARLLQRFRAGDRDALEQVYRAYVDKIANIARFGFRSRAGTALVGGVGFDATEIADIAQEVFVKAFSDSARRAFDGQREYGPYLYAIARNAIADQLHRSGRELPTAWKALEQTIDGELDAGTREGATETDPALVEVTRDYIARLDGDLKRVHQARYVEGLSQRDAAERLGMGRQALRTLEEHLRDGLRRELGGRFALTASARH